jgi:sugar O-acyltransferase (sialic acid O-acetyltransferase NeuD family)
MNTLIIIGAGGHGRVVADCAEATNRYKNIVFLDDCYPERKKNLHWDIIGVTASFTQHIDNAEFIVAFGNNKLRAEILDELKNAHVKLASVIHPSAIVSRYSKIGLGVVVFANSVINIGTTIENGVIVNTASTIDHDCAIGQCVHISPGVNIAGGVTIGEQSWVGIGAAVIECITIENNTQIAAGAVVTKPTQAHSLYAGVPATYKKSNIL